MDAVMFVKEWKRMCRSSKTCLSCGIGKIAGVSTVCSNAVKNRTVACLTCDYIAVHGHTRDCDPRDCVEKGVFKRRKGARS